MSTEDIKAISDAYRSIYTEPEVIEEDAVEEEQLDEAAKTANQIAKRADTLSKNINEFEKMLKSSKPQGAGRDYDRAVDEFRDAYISLTDAIAKVEGMMQ